MKHALLLLAAAASLSACTPKGAVFLYIEAQRDQLTLKIPDDVDRVTVQVTDAADPGKVLLDKSWTLTNEQFPLTLGLEPGDQTPSRIRFVITLFKGDQPVGGTETIATFPPGEVNTVTARVIVE